MTAVFFILQRNSVYGVCRRHASAASGHNGMDRFAFSPLVMPTENKDILYFYRTLITVILSRHCLHKWNHAV
jgi:hypothetical protein